ncbi:MAG TPA: hypothetical protein VKB59_22535 [Micromonosporaceae bacterium]|nr:hypothetical protein [Micromonosporaceae bacterium]
MPAEPAGALADRAPRGGGAKAGERRAARDTRVDRGKPPWRAWRTRSRAARAIRFIETYCRIPSGARAGELMRLHRFQKEDLEELLARDVRTGGLQIPRGNAKSTTWAAVGLWAVCDHEDAPQVPLVAFNGLQANRTLLRPIRSMVRAHPDLAARVIVYTSTTDRRVWSAWNDGDLLALPADVERAQGLNPTVALVDEAQTVSPPVFAAILQGAGKRAASLVLAIGTPAPNAQTSALFQLREQARAGARVAWREHAADAGCALTDRRQWRKANPAIRAGLLFEDVLAAELDLVSDAEFRMYRLGQWIDATLVGWLPGTAWDDCPATVLPDDGADVVLGLAGTYASTFAVIGATFDGGLFTGWIGNGTEADLEDVLLAARERWHVVELVVQPRILTNLVRRLVEQDWPVTVWPHTTEVEVSSATEWRRAIIEGRVAHDHEPVLAAHVAATVGAPTPDGSLKLAAPDDGRPIDAARAARMAWWRTMQEPALEAPAIF